MPKAVSNLDTSFLENLTAQALSIKDLCQLLADMLDHPDQLDALKDIYDTAERIRSGAIGQRQFLREVHHE